MKLSEIRQEMKTTKSARRYRQLLAMLGGGSGTGSVKKRAAAIKANKARWKNHVVKPKKSRT